MRGPQRVAHRVESLDDGGWIGDIDLNSERAGTVGLEVDGDLLCRFTIDVQDGDVVPATCEVFRDRASEPRPTTGDDCYPICRVHGTSC